MAARQAGWQSSTTEAGARTESYLSVEDPEAGADGAIPVAKTCASRIE